MASPILVLLSNVLRLGDNAALLAAAGTGNPVVPVFIYDTHSQNVRQLGAASKWWLLQSLASLSSELEALGSKLIVRQGVSIDVVSDLAEETKARGIYLCRGYAPAACAFEKELQDRYADTTMEIRRFGGHLLLEPEMIRTKTGSNYTVFTPFWRAASELIDTTPPQPAPNYLKKPDVWPPCDDIENLGLEPKPAHWAVSLARQWQPGEAGAQSRLDVFLKDCAQHYKAARDFPVMEATSALSPHLAFGEISPRTLWWRTKQQLIGRPELQTGCAHFLRELGWREFSAHLLFNNPNMQYEPMREQFKGFPWETGNGASLKRWQAGQTGFPIVDAGMRQLWQTGWMHNRVRMIVASFLVKDLLWHWRDGEAWFWDTLVDADFGNNITSWQWVAGCGADAAPYFRIFNPVTQGQKFDPDGSYVRRFVPELKDMPAKYIHNPSEAPDAVCVTAGVRLGETYPLPMIDRKIAREKALAALASIKKSQ